MKLYQELEAHLKTINNYVTDEGELKKWVVINKAQNMDVELVSILLDNDTLKAQFFIEAKGALVFNQNKFVQFLEQKNYLNDSYTAYKNKIGLTIDGKYLKQRNEVALVWPYKDCVLEGGQSKEEDKREEIFFNEILAQDEITQLLDPKVLTNAKVYDKEGEHTFTGFSRDGTINKKRGLPEDTITDNLILKGNNLLALHSLQKEFAGKVKLIYIDPPYNTGNDSFGYNDNFNHSSWLTFMRNRLSIAKDLLKKDGFILVQCDDNEQAYLKVMMDQIFGAHNFDNCITTIVKTEGRRYGNLAKSHEYILMYAKNILYSTANEIEKIGHKFKHTDSQGGFDLTDLRNQNAAAFNSKNRPNLRYPFYVNAGNPNDDNLCEVSLEPKKGFVEVFPITVNNFKSVWRWGKEKAQNNIKTNLVARKSSDGIFRIFQKYRSNTTMEKTVWFDKNFISNKGTKELDLLFGEKVFGFPKPEALIRNIVTICTNQDDIILDFFAGSGTTAAVAMKKKRQFITTEQMDYVQDVTIARLQKVAEGEQGGISKAVNWQGGGSFTYLELKKHNQTFIEQIEAAKTTKALLTIWEDMKAKSFLNYNVDLQEQERHMAEFKADTLANQKQLLVRLLDLNQLYVNVSSLEDKDLACTEEEKQVTRDFYQMKSK